VPGLRILHQAGARFAEAVTEAYGISGADATRWEVAAFLDDMPRRFAEADLILCRSGASTVAELAAAGKAAVLVPLPTAADNHQLKNAEAFAAAGAAELRVQSGDVAMESFLLSDLAGLLLDAGRRREMSRRVRGLAHPDAVREIGQMAAELGGVPPPIARG
jgi:UDP-N-acetylglucosamine--N-acetylmuramyl-(pentapeptide) pyrophosphoryl-undecaprenol N-acetylglucosamine transferase